MKICLGYQRSIAGVGWKSVDVAGTPDILDDAFKLESIEDKSCEIIVASHILEHGPYHGTTKERFIQVIDVLQLWNMKLVPHGRLFIGVPNFHWMVMHYLEVAENFHNADFDLAGPILGAGPDRKDMHTMIFNNKILEQAMFFAGFHDIEVLQRCPPEMLPQFNTSCADVRGLNMTGVANG